MKVSHINNASLSSLYYFQGVVVVVYWLSYGLAEQMIRGSNLGLATLILEIGNLLLPSCDMIEILFK